MFDQKKSYFCHTHTCIGTSQISPSVVRNTKKTEALKINTNAMNASEKKKWKDLIYSMIYPEGSCQDSSPLYVICCNDTCSFTWTGAEHINQVIIELFMYE